MIAYRDFEPTLLEEKTAFKLAKYAPFASTVEKANRWISDERISALNVETVVLPNMYQDAGEESSHLYVGKEEPVSWYQFVRVWYVVK